MAVVEAVTAELEELRASGALAATALTMAEILDSQSSATSKSMCAKVLVDTMEKLRAAAPPKEVRDGITDIAAARDERRRRAAGRPGT